jgi:uncharacterized membrane protein
MVAALYTVLTISFHPISYGVVQFRVSEALTVLPAVFTAAIPGLFLGCVISNAFSLSGMVIADMVFGSLASLISAFLTSYIAKVLEGKNSILRLALIPLPPVIVNTLVIGALLSFFYGLPYFVAASGVFIGQAGVCYLLGCPLYLLICGLKKSKWFKSPIR